MNIEGQIRILSRLLSRYFNSQSKKVSHFFDCEIYAIQAFCGCGLLHDLQYLDYSLSEIIYPKINDDVYYQEFGKKLRHNKKENLKAKAILEEMFGKIEPPSLEELKIDYDGMKKVLNNCCTYKSFPSAYRNLNKWLTNKINQRYV